MSVVGESVTVMQSSDPTKLGLGGKVVLETANTLLISSGGRKLSVEKKGLALALKGSRRLVTGEDIAGRLEDRLGGRKA
jgi:RNase P/RNase MRP subunit p29